MKRVLVLVEGQSEEVFVGRSLKPHLNQRGIDPTPKIVTTRRNRAGPDNKGGVQSWDKIQRELRLLLGDSSVVAVTTMIDYYGLPGDVPGMSDRPRGPARIMAQHVQLAIDASFRDPRMRSHLVLHEFEAMLYTDAATCGQYLGSAALEAAMAAAVRECGEPELVNDDPQRSPSRRIEAAYPTYKKTVDGPSLIDLIGIDRIRDACPHFHEWLLWLEGLGLTST